jgi:phosphomannomutase
MATVVCSACLAEIADTPGARAAHEETCHVHLLRQIAELKAVIAEYERAFIAGDVPAPMLDKINGGK